METDYLGSIATLSQAEQIAIADHDFDTLSRLYFPLQEARRQKRQRCGEGIVRLDFISNGVADRSVGADAVLASHPHGQLLVAGWGSIEPALAVRRMAAERSLYVETFLAAAYPIVGGERAVVIVPLPESRLPDVSERSIDALLKLVPPHSIVMNASSLPRGDRRGTTATYAETMAMWEQLHAPYLAAADAEGDLLRRMDGYRKTIRVDDACERAHQNLAITARDVDRQRRRGVIHG